MNNLVQYKVMAAILCIAPLFNTQPIQADAYEIDLLKYDPYESHDPEYCSPVIENPPLILDENLIDLEASPQDFVLETKKLQFEGFKGAFNPSITRYQDQILIAFRGRDPKTGSTHPIVIAKLDENFNPIAPPQVLPI